MPLTPKNRIPAKPSPARPRLATLCLAFLCLPNASYAQSPSGSLTFATYLGGDGSDIVTAMVTDASGNIYLTGSTLSSNFPVTPGAFQTKHAGQPGTVTGILSAFPAPVPDAFVVKLNPAGRIVYATYLGGAGADQGLGIAVDSAGSAYIVGSTGSQNFPVTPGALQTRLAGSFDVFVARLSPDGATLLSATYLGGAGFDTAGAIALDPSGNICIAGQAAADFPVTPGAYQPQGQGAFAAKLNPAATALLYATFLGDNGSGTATGIALDAAGDAYLVGTTSNTTFPVTPGAIHSAIGVGNAAAFLVKLNPQGSAAAWSSLLGGHGNTTGARIAVDAQGNAFLAGSTDAPDFPVTSSAFQKSLAGGTDAFVLKLNSAGTDLVYSTLLGGSETDTLSGFTLDSAGNTFVSGSTFSTNFPVTADSLPRRFAGSPCLVTGGTPFGNPPGIALCGDAFAAKLNPTGSALVYSTTLSGSDRESATAVAVATSGTMYLAGWTRSGNFPAADVHVPATCVVSNSPSSRQSDPCEDGFIARIDFNGPAAPPALRVVNFSSLLDLPVAPAEVVTLFGAVIGPATPATLQLDSNNQITTVLAGTRVLFDGVAAPLIRVDSAQISGIVPNSVAGKAHSLVSVERNGQTVATTTVVIGAASPAVLVAANLDGTVSSPSSPTPADSIVSLYATGMGATSQPDGALATTASSLSPLPVVVVGGQLAQVLYVGPSPTLTAALTQLNIRVPATAGGQLPVFILANGFSSQFGAILFVK